MKKELTTRVFQAAVAKLDAATHGSVNELYTIAEISDILEAWRNKIAPKYDEPDVPELDSEHLVYAFCRASELFPGKECVWCDTCRRLSQMAYIIEDAEVYCCRECAKAAGYTDDDLNVADSGEDAFSYFVDFTA